MVRSSKQDLDGRPTCPMGICKACPFYSVCDRGETGGLFDELFDRVMAVTKQWVKEEELLEVDNDALLEQMGQVLLSAGMLYLGLRWELEADEAFGLLKEVLETVSKGVLKYKKGGDL